MPVANLVPVSNKQSTGVSRGDTPHINRFIPVNEMPNQQPPIGKTPLVPDTRYNQVLTSGANVFSSLMAQTGVQDTDLPCEGVNMDIGIVRSRYKQINNIPNLAGAYPQPITAHGPGIGLAVNPAQLNDLNNKVLRPANTYNLWTDPPFPPPSIF